MSRYQKILAGTFLVAWVLSWIHPIDFHTWMIENILVVIFVPTLILIGRYFRLSDLSYTFITLFLVMHLIGAHWTYGQVPFGWYLGHLIGSDRNMYDRVVHFAFGLLMSYPIREMFMRVTGARGVWSYYLPFDVVLSFSAMYEIFEWVGAVLVMPATAEAFLGAGGDFWDTQKDMAAAAIGALIAMLGVFVINMIFKKTSLTEMKESLRIKTDEPIPEGEL